MTLKAAFMALMLILPVGGWAEVRLLMAEEVGCIYCARWNAEISEIYPKTPEGQAAPLQRYELNRDDPEVDFASRVRFTPTFILVSNGVEIGRIEGYPGEDFFWGLLGMMLRDANIPMAESG